MTRRLAYAFPDDDGLDVLPSDIGLANARDYLALTYDAADNVRIVEIDIAILRDVTSPTPEDPA